MEIADGFLIIVGKRERLKPGEGRVAQITIHADLDLHAVDAADVVKQRADQNDRDIEQQISGQPIEAPQGDKMVQSIALKERDAYIDKAAGGAGEEHQEQSPAIVPEPGREPAETE